MADRPARLAKAWAAPRVQSTQTLGIYDTICILGIGAMIRIGEYTLLYLGTWTHRLGKTSSCCKMYLEDWGQIGA